jgi:hypothetical protein
MTRQLSNGPYFITTAPTMTTCYRCHRLVLAATVGGLDYRIDVDPLTEMGELTALLSKRATFDLTGELLTQRGPERIRDHPPTTVLAQHTCAPTLQDHISAAHMTAAICLVQHLLGAEVLDTTTTAPF